MLTVPRNIQATCLLRRGMPTIFSAPGEFSTGEVGNFQPAETGEYSTGIDSRTFRGGWGQRAGIDQSRNLGDPAGRGKGNLTPAARGNT